MRLYTVFPFVYFQIFRLHSTWTSVKQQNESVYQSFRTKLPSYYNSLRLASSALPLQNVTIPYIIPLLDMLQSPPCAHEFIWQELNITLFSPDFRHS